VTAAREWESEQWRTAVLLDEFLVADWWTRSGGIESEWNFGYAEPAPGPTGRFLVTCWDDDKRRVIVVALTAGPGSAEDQARGMADRLLATPDTQWPISQRIDSGNSPAQS
jgi:hypothetical protein